MKEKWGFTSGWTSYPPADEPELVHTCTMGGKEVTYPPFLGFKDKLGQTHRISKVIAVAIGLVGLNEPTMRMTWEEWGRFKEKK